MRVLGIDPGSKRVGLSLSDESGLVAQPLRTLQRAGKEALLKDLCAVIAETESTTVVLGLPLQLSGEEGHAARRARALGSALREAAGVEVVLWDERLTSVVAERSLTEAGVRGARRREVVDQAAATLLLQSYLDAQSGGGAPLEYDAAMHELPLPEPGRGPGKGRALTRGQGRRIAKKGRRR